MCRTSDITAESLKFDSDRPGGEPCGHGAVDIECHPALVEQTLFLAIAGLSEEVAYHAAREACYLEPDPEQRNRLFLQLEREWFVKLDLARPAIDALAEWPSILSRVQRCILAPAIRRRDGYAELYGIRPMDKPKPNLLIRLEVDLFKNPVQMRAFMRRELMHIDDMLDPAFKYNPSLSQFFDECGVPNATRDRYRALWDAHIDGRISTRFKTESDSRSRNRSEFNRLFRVLGSHCADAFDWIVSAPPLSHPEILGYARAPLTLLVHFDTTSSG